MRIAYLVVVLASMAFAADAIAQNIIQTSAPRGGGIFVGFGDVAPLAGAKPGLIPASAVPSTATAPTPALTPVALPLGLAHYRRNPVTTPVDWTSALPRGVAMGGAMPNMTAPTVAAAATEAVPAADRRQSVSEAATASAATHENESDMASAQRLATRPLAPWQRPRQQGMRFSNALLPPRAVADPTLMDGLRPLDGVSGPIGMDWWVEDGIPCDDCGVPCPCPCPCIWQHCTSVRASALYLRPRDAEVAYAVPIDGPISALLDSPIQVGPVGVLDPDYEVGFDGGIAWAIDCVTSITADYRYLASTTADQITTSAPFVIRSLVAHPSTTSAAADFLTASAESYIEMNLLDVGVRHLFVGGEAFAVNYFIGTRIGRLEQTFDSLFEDNGTEQVGTDIDFDGAGVRIGIEAERYASHCCLRGYGRAHASFLAGRFEGGYRQQQSFDPTVVDTSWEAGRVVPILDLELGVGWTSRSGCLKLNVGYMFSSWFNMVKTDDIINAVQANDFTELADALSFDGLVGHVELSY